MKRRELLIVCAGDQACITADFALRSGWYTGVSVLPIASKGVAREFTCPVLLGKETELDALRERFDEVVVATGNNQLRLEQTLRFLEAGFSMPPIIHPEACVNPSAQIGEGSYISARAVVGPWAVIGRACLINTSVIVEHDCVLGDGVHLSPNAAMGGHTVIGERTWICVGVSIGDAVTIGKGTVVGAGAAVVRDIGDNVMAAGVPAVVKKQL